MSDSFASGKYALGICDRCGWQWPLLELSDEVVNKRPTGVLVCQYCLDEDHPQLQLGETPVYDPQALKNPMPDSRSDVGPNPVLVGYTSYGAPIFSFSGLNLPRRAGNFASTPDTAEFTVSTTLEIIAKLTLIAWNDPTEQAIVCQWGEQLTPSPQASWLFDIYNGTLRFTWTSSGVYSEFTTVASTAVVPFTAGSAGYVKFTIDINGVTDFAINFYTGLDGNTWTQLGSTQTVSATFPQDVIYFISRWIEIGSRDNGTLDPLGGAVQYLQLGTTVGGAPSVVFDPLLDAETGDTSFTSSATGNDWSIYSSGTSGAFIAVPSS
jgi:hypothetical protein